MDGSGLSEASEWPYGTVLRRFYCTIRTEATYAKEPIAITAQAVKQSVSPGETIVIRVF
jgi:hypothetical protein